MDPARLRKAMEHQRRLIKYAETFTSRDPKEVVRGVREGKDFPTQCINAVNDVNFNNKLVQNGLIDALLDHLQRCNERFDADKIEVAFPSVWVNNLCNILCPGNLREDLGQQATIRTVERIEPVLTLMSDFDRRIFFQDQKNWARTLSIFLGMLNNITMNANMVKLLREKYGKKIDNFVIQSLFLELYHPKAVAQLRRMQEEDRSRENGLPGYVSGSQFQAARILQEFVDVGGPRMTQADTETLQNLADVKVGAKTFSTELLNVMKSNKDIEPKAADSIRYIFQKLYVGLGPYCFGQDHLVASLIPVCQAHKGLVLTHYLECASVSLRPLYTQADNLDDYSEDAETSVAVANGLVELTIESFLREPSTKEVVSEILECVGSLSMQPLTNKALRKGEESVRKALHKLKKRRSGGQIVSMVEDIYVKVNIRKSGASSLNPMGLAFCRSCYAPLPAEKILRCAKCKRATYCSKECQIRDWKEGGHKQQCKAMKTMDLKNLEEGKSTVEARQAAKAEKNLSRAGEEAISNNLRKFMMLCSIEGVGVTERVIFLDFTGVTTRISTMTLEEFKDGHPESERGDQLKHSVFVFERNRRNGALTVACFNGTGMLLKTVPAAHASSFPEHATNISKLPAERRWLALQKQWEVPGLDAIIADDERKKLLIEELSVATMGNRIF